jgi:hypothetical protein
MWLKRKAYMLLVGKAEGKGQFERPRSWWVDNIKMEFGEIVLGVLYWTGLIHDNYLWRVVVNEPSGSIKCWDVLGWLHNRWPL